MSIEGLREIAGLDRSNTITKSGVNTDNSTAFEKVLSSAMDMIDETNALQKDAQQAAINYELGYSDDSHTLAVAQQKANIALTYTVAVRDKIVDAYRELMQMSI